MSSTSPRLAAFCRFCGLPVFHRRTGRSDEPALTAVYCCYGCRIAESIANDRASESGMGGIRARIGFSIFFSMNVIALSMALWTQDQPGATPSEAGHEILTALLRYVCLFLSFPVVWILGKPLFESARQELQQRRPGMDCLLIAGVAAAMAYSIAATLSERGHVYFEVACVVLIVAAIGRWLEALGKLNAAEALTRIERLIPTDVRVAAEGGDRLVPADSIVSGDVVRALPGECIPCDGRSRTDFVELDERMVTGEIAPVLKRFGDRIFAGTFAVGGPVEIVASGPVGAGTLARLTNLVRESAARKGRFERLADRLSRWFAPVVGMIALAAGVYHGAGNGIESGLMTSLSVGLIACPCALALATPMAFWVVRTQAAGEGIILLGDAIEKLARVQLAFFDKTGTLTCGQPAVYRRWHAPDGDVADAERLTASLARESNHPVSQALAAAKNSDRVPIENVVYRSGRGLSASAADGRLLFLGSERGLIESGVRLPQFREDFGQDGGCTAVGLAVDGILRAKYWLADAARSEARDAVNWLRELGIRVLMLTGDRQGPARRLADELSLEFECGLLPDEKAGVVESARRSMSKTGTVAFIGDGVNDAPSIAAADVGIAMGCGADLTRASADVCLLGNDLRSIPCLIEMSTEAMKIAKQNLFWAFAYNIVGVGLAAGGWLHPIFAGFAMAASSLLVVGNSLRLKQFVPSRRIGRQYARTDDASAGSAFASGEAVAAPKPSMALALKGGVSHA